VLAAPSFSSSSSSSSFLSSFRFHLLPLTEWHPRAPPPHSHLSLPPPFFAGCNFHEAQAHAGDERIQGSVPRMQAVIEAGRTIRERHNRPLKQPLRKPCKPCQ